MTSSITPLVLPVSPAIETLQPYVPGKPISETQRETGLKRVFKLASNENPLGPSPKALAAIRKSLAQLQLYPDASGFELKATVAKALKKYQVSPREIVLGSGSDDLIEILVRSFCRPAPAVGQGGALAQPKLSFVAYSVCAAAHGVEVIQTALINEAEPWSEELGKSFLPDLDALWSQGVLHPRVSLIFCANPNNPTGAHLPESAWREFVLKLHAFNEERQKKGLPRKLLVLDDAYVEFSQDLTRTGPFALELQRQFPQDLVVIRTFSKAYGLGGLRVGYLVGHPEIASVLNRVKQPFNVSSVGLVGAQAALGDRLHVQKTLRVNKAGLQIWKKAAARNRWKIAFSPTNFFLLHSQTSFGLNGKAFSDRLLHRGWIVRPLVNYGLTEWVRISFGRPSENLKLIRELERWK